jgi:hypothetical protein
MVHKKVRWNFDISFIIRYRYRQFQKKCIDIDLYNILCIMPAKEFYLLGARAANYYYLLWMR